MRVGDTIFAVSTGPGKAAVKICRLSGPRSRSAAEALGAWPLEPRKATLRRFRDGRDGSEIDRGLVLWFPAPGSFTGEDMLEIQFHGSAAVERALLARLIDAVGLRPAEAGEFTWRAFQNGKMDLTEAEGLADLLDAQTEAQRRQAVAQASGQFRQEVDAWRRQLIDALAGLESRIDFEDEADVADHAGEDERRVVEDLIAALDAALAGAQRSEIVRHGFQVVILGPPNAGKSSLLNALARRDAAIVAATPGTTRDLIEIDFEIDGLKIVLVDTAGIRDSGDDVERIGMGRALRRAEGADLLVWLDPEGAAPSGVLPDRPVLAVRSKADLEMSRAPSRTDGLRGDAFEQQPGLAVSSLTGYGLDALLDAVATRARVRLGAGDAAPPSINLRQSHLVALALDVLRRVADHDPPEIVAEALREASSYLEEIVGRVDSEQVLDQIFSRFCIGK